VDGNVVPVPRRLILPHVAKQATTPRVLCAKRVGGYVGKGWFGVLGRHGCCRLCSSAWRLCSSVWR